jgi:DNA-binding FadR family transcriptional regulator
MSYDSTKLDFKLFHSMMDTRRLVERECVRLSVARDCPAEYAKIKEALACIRAGKRDELVDALFDYHYLLTQSSGYTRFPDDWVSR